MTNRSPDELLQTRTTTRRAFLRAVVIGAGVLVACGPSTPPSGPPAKSEPAAPPGQPKSAEQAAKTAPATKGKPSTVQEIAMYNSADRQQVLEAGARAEGKLAWYTSLIVNQAVVPLSNAFQKKYPFIAVEHFRANSADVTQRISTEYQARQFAVSVVDGTSSVPALKVAGLLTPFYSPSNAPYTAELKSSDGTWTAFKLAFSTLGYNTQLVQAADVPKTHDDLLDPRWKGKMGWSTSVGSGGPDFVGNILAARGQEGGMAYLQKLAQQDVRNYSLAVRAVLDQVIAGEVPMGIHISNHHAIISKGKGAPVDWVPLEPVPVALQSVALPTQAASPHAAMLFIDFILSEEGQKVLRDNEYIPSLPGLEGVAPGLRMSDAWFKTTVINPDQAQTKETEWNKIFQELFVR
jgi:ABC-type Fe3+ transport system substrate-binding protein